MERQELLIRALAVWPFLTSSMFSRKENVEDEGLRKANDDTAPLSAVVIDSAEDAAEAKLAQPVMVTLGRMIFMIRTPRRRCVWWRGLTLLAMLCGNSPRRDRDHWQGPSLPPGCVMVVRYTSR